MARTSFYTSKCLSFNMLLPGNHTCIATGDKIAVFLKIRC